MYLTRKRNNSILSTLLDCETVPTGLLLATVQAMISLLVAVLLTTPLLG